MTTSKMTFHESYGQLPVSTMRLIRKYNVSPADFDAMINFLACPKWDEVETHIRENSATGMYVCLYV